MGGCYVVRSDGHREIDQSLLLVYLVVDDLGFLALKRSVPAFLRQCDSAWQSSRPGTVEVEPRWSRNDLDGWPEHRH